MESIDLYILNDIDNFSNLMVMSDNQYKTIIEYINFNYLLIIFTIGCFGSILCCNINNIKNNKYVIVPTTDPVEGKIIQSS